VKRNVVVVVVVDVVFDVNEAATTDRILSMRTG
jgi:hypothetical protein